MADVLNLQVLISQLQNVVIALGTLTQQISTSTSAIFPQTQGTASSATPGSVASPGNFSGFLEFKLPDGTTKKIGYFDV